MSKKIILLGSTGSIGTQCLEVCRIQGFSVVALVANSNIHLLEEQAREFAPKIVVTANEELLPQLKKNLADLPIMVLAGGEAIVDLVTTTKADIIVNAVTGIAGLRPTLATLKAGKKLALANKEALIVGGELVMDTAKKYGGTIYPVDSEHSAIWQSLESGKREELRSIILTASGGPFFGKTQQELEQVTVQDALDHPNWSMGKKITIDSATLMNKGLEFIEAMWLFDLSPQQIDIVIHRESIVHSAVQYHDGSVIAQMGVPDMRVAIQYALTYPHRLPLNVKPLSLTDYATLTFEKADWDTFSCLQTAIEAAKMGGLMPCVINGANEMAVDLFLKEKISFTDIGRLVRLAFEEVRPTDMVSLESIEAADRAAREFVLQQSL